MEGRWICGEEVERALRPEGSKWGGRPGGGRSEVKEGRCLSAARWVEGWGWGRDGRGIMNRERRSPEGKREENEISATTAEGCLGQYKCGQYPRALTATGTRATRAKGAGRVWRRKGVLSAVVRRGEGVGSSETMRRGGTRGGGVGKNVAPPQGGVAQRRTRGETGSRGRRKGVRRETERGGDREEDRGEL